jgi:hypothetical protein
LLCIAAASPEFLVNLYSELESAQVSYVAGCGQIPQPIDVDSGGYDVPGATSGSVVRLSFQRLYVNVNAIGQVAVTRQFPTDAVRVAHATQVVAFVRLSDHQARYYRNYRQSVTPAGLIDRYINPDNHPQHLGRKRTASMWEGEIASHARSHFLHALGFFVQHYRILTRRNLLWPQTVYGLFFMLRPGRVVATSASIPLTSAYIGPHDSTESKLLSRETLEHSLRLRIPFVDEFVPQLLSYTRLFDAGEAELGWIGAVSLVEEYLSRFVVWTHENRRPSISQSLRRPPVNAMSPDLIARLAKFAQVRNELAHRGRVRTVPTRTQFNELIDTALEMYRQTQITKRRIEELL